MSDDITELSEVVTNLVEKSKFVSSAVGKLVVACRDDNYYEFKKLLDQQTGRIQNKTSVRLLAFNTILGIFNLSLVLSADRIKHCQKYISLVFIVYKLMEEEEFLDVAKDGQVLMHFVSQYVVKYNCVGNLVSFLMPDWFDVASHKAKSYCLIKKFGQYEEKEGRKLLEKLYEVIDDDSKLMFRDACLRIIYQYLLELHKSNIGGKEDETLLLLNQHLCIDKVHSMQNQEYKQLILEVIVVFWPPNCSSDSYRQAKQKIFEIGRNEHATTSSDDAYDDQPTFFNLVFLLKENHCVKFQNIFEKFIEAARKKYGAFFKIALKHQVRLLAIIAEGLENLTGAREFIYQKFPYIEVNSTIMTSFHVVQDFKVFNFFPFKSEKLQLLGEILPRFADQKHVKKHMDELKEIISEYKDDQSSESKELKKFVFGRNIHCDKTVFERILSTPGTSKLIDFVWNKFELSSNEEIFNIKFCCCQETSGELSQGKFLLNYVLESKDDENLTTFLNPKNSEQPTFSREASFLKLKGDQLYELSKKTLFERHLITCLKDVFRDHQHKKTIEDGDGQGDGKARELSSTSFVCIVSLLEELSEFGMVSSVTTTMIRKLMNLASNPKFYEELGVNSNNSNVEGDFRRKIYHVDDLLATVVSYCTKSDKIYVDSKESLSKLSPLFDLLANIIEDNQTDFIASFNSKLEGLETICHDRYRTPENVEHDITSFLYNLLWAAVIHDRKLIIDHIMEYKNFATVTLKYPENVRNTKMCHYVAMKLLRSGHEIGENQLPSSWISRRDFGNFLDSRIKYESSDLIGLDCNFLLHNQTRKYQVKTRDDVDSKLIFWEDTDSLSHIIRKENFKSFLTHPVIETYIDLKTHKYQNIYLCNVAAFVLLFILPFSLLFTRRFLFNVQDQSVNLTFCFISIFLLLLRELFQLLLVDQCWKKYLKKASNWLEILLVLFSLGTVVIFIFEESHSFKNRHALQVIFVATIFLALTVLAATVPLSFVSLNMMMLKKALQTFVLFLLTFTLILIAFSLSFCMMFGTKLEGNQQTLIVSNSSTNWNSTSPDNSHDGPFENFSTFPTAFSKVLLMLSGEYTVEPFDLRDVYQGIFFLFFVISTFVLFNLIQGLTFDDVQKLRKDASRLILQQNAKKFIDTSEIYFKFYEYYNLPNTKTEDLKSFPRCLVKLNARLIGRNPFVHKIGKVYINMKTKEITTEVNRSQVLIVKEKLKDKVFKNILDILDKQVQL